MILTSPVIHEGSVIPFEYTGDGVDKSPPLSWSDPPAGTHSFAIICQDPDAPQPEPWVHWLVYNIPASATNLPQGVPGTEAVSSPIPLNQGTNSFGHASYNGPLPPYGHGWHRYYFELFALDEELSLKPGVQKQQLVEAMKGHILGKAKLMGRYQRETVRRRAS